MNAEELSKYIDEILKNNYIEYNYVVDIEKCLDYITKKVSHNIKDINNINSMIKETFKDYLKIEIQSKNNLLNIINNIIETKKNSPNILETISIFLSELDYTIEPDNIIEVLKKNKEINSLIKEIVEKNKKEITEGKIRDIQNDETIISFIEAYCELNNIDTIPQDDLTTIVTGDINHDYLREISRIKVLTKEEERALIKRINQGDELARVKMIESNLKLVVFVAKQYRGYNLPFEDLIQEGNIGLMKAIEKYDINKGYKFSTYATWWIRQSIIRAIEEKSRIIKITSHIDHQFAKYKKAKIKLFNIIGREPNYKELEEYTGINEDKIKLFERISYEPISINTKVSDQRNTEPESELINFIPVEDEELTEKIYIRDMQTRLKRLLNSDVLEDKERRVLILIYGIDTKPKTFAEVGAILNMSRQRIKQVEKEALRKLSKNKDAKELADVFNDGTKTTEEIKPINKPKKKVKNKVSNQMPVKTTIYEYFEKKYNFTKEQVDEGIANLSEKDKEVIFIANGEDLEHPIRTEGWNEKTHSQYYSHIIPVLLRVIYNKDKPIPNSRPRKEPVKKEKIIQKPTKEILEEESIETTPSVNQINIVTDEDYLNLLKIMRAPIFNQLYEDLSMKEMIVTFLNIGLLEEKHFTEEAISTYFNIKKEEINQIINKSLTNYGDKIERIERYFNNNSFVKKLTK